ncbi:hypothetical protein [Paenibacillus sp. NPDC058177]|uniref:hypothetical protein n=1 Tax=Paenibacillus sp. NPDC058177 TaxID=3346369 RepID=UPI0036DB3E50
MCYFKNIKRRGAVDLKKLVAVTLIVANVISVPIIASAKEENINNVTDTVYQESSPNHAMNSNFDFRSEAINSNALKAMEEYKALYSDIVLKNYSELKPEEIDQMSVHLNKLLGIMDSISDNGTLIQAKGYDESNLSKGIELVYNVNLSGLSTLHVLEGANAATPARKAGEAYALANGWGGTVWDNPADALRHFSWNFLMGQRIGLLPREV